MSGSRPPALPEAHAAAARSVARAVGVAKVSSITMLVLGALSMLVSIQAPLSASFAISIAVFANGWIERHFGRRLAAHCTAAPARLALNQLVLGLEVVAYAAWQAHAIGPAQIDAVLRRPAIARFLGALDPAVLGTVIEQLPSAVRLLYLVVGAATLLGCLATAGYYLSRMRALRILGSSPGPACPPIPRATSP